ncbi:3-hydroxyacyl-CoA dehydrogenase NAD-binding domain-containing protein [Candidatus Ichthyocystis hellenicum]|uniref:3-hydroxyacyl-CoA dehydrogenase NAD-binding domain-containing protein n=1 Tax=Candidatus Ichthyocystis hellenicum TaxID=1561003 RepID=UPI000A4EF296|nr:3-hydroxyacyl-CoA dehydrogenase NAD-binding domain-containing protein [Candidatus Ichthyocystis hellenicum]
MDRSIKVAVFGSGTMGSGIAQVAAAAGFSVVVVDLEESSLQKSRVSVENSLDRLLKKGTISSSDKKDTLSRIKWMDSTDGISSLFLAIEAIPEEVSLKGELIRRVSENFPGVLLASNTSSISLSLLASFSLSPENVVGMHFFNPVPIMKLVEVIRALQTSDSVFEMALSFVRELGKVPICVSNRPGFAVNRILLVMLNEAFFAYSEGVASAEDIDEAMKLGCNHPIGPLALADMIGLDVCLKVCEQLYEQFSDPKYRPCPLLREMVEAGFTGRKSGRGFYKY